MAARSAGLIAASVVVLALGCGEGAEQQAPATLLAADVESLPVGNAVGTSYSGLYVLSEATVTACVCRAGSCSEWMGSSSGSFALTQTDGALRLVLRTNTSETTYDGGIDRDGKFRVGGSRVDQSSAAYSILSGTVEERVGMELKSQNTLTGPVNGKSTDCDVEVKLAATFVASL